jgi:glucosamine-6-phosphate deaminase
MSITYIKSINANEIGDKVAQLFIQQVKKRPDSVFILATGSSPITTYQAIVKDYQKNHTDWSKVTTFNLDEYIGLTQQYANQSYAYFMNENLFNHLNVKKTSTYFPNKNLVGDKYQKLIDQYHQVDLAILGVGNNGHIAFNEPGTTITTQTHVVDLTDSSRQANARFFDNNIDNVPKQAVTMGLKEILSAKQIVLIATGKAKKTAIEHLKQAKDFDPN